MAKLINVNEYIKELKKGKGCIEIDAILIALYLKAELQVYTLDESGLIKQLFNFNQKEERRVRVYLEPNGRFDTIYNKSTIKSAGICQSILLDVILLFNLSL